MANETVFTNKAADYAAGRPGYAPQAIAYLLTNMIETVTLWGKIR